MSDKDADWFVRGGSIIKRTMILTAAKTVSISLATDAAQQFGLFGRRDFA